MSYHTILRDAFDFIDTKNKVQAVAGCVSSGFSRAQIGLESLGSLAIVFEKSEGTLIRPKQYLPRKGLELLITRMVHQN